jgi:RNase P protein component
MAGQGLLFRTISLVSNCRLLFNTTRLPQVSQVSGLKQRIKDRLKELKVPDKPKRPLTPYFRFIQDHRESLIKQHPNWKVTQISVQCASDWKMIDSSAKEKYEKDYKEEMEKYAAKHVQYLKSLTDEQKVALEEYSNEVKRSRVKRQKRKKLRDTHKPKRPIGAYMLFVMDQAKSNPDKMYSQLLADLKGKWADMSKSEKAKYTEAAAIAKAKYDKELVEWELKMIEEGNLDVVRQSTLLNNSSKIE